jgi:predicted nucleic acid-binding protein
LIVVDASVLVDAFTDDGPAGERSRAELARDEHWLAPEHFYVEVLSALRGLHLGGKLGARRAGDALDAVAASNVELVHAKPLLHRMWELRDNLSGYDAAYVATAESLRCPLLTADARLARASGLPCEVRLSAGG